MPALARRAPLPELKPPRWRSRLGSGSLGVLGLVILIRTFLSISFGVEIDGRWPWRRAAGAEAPAPAEKPNTGDYL